MNFSKLLGHFSDKGSDLVASCWKFLVVLVVAYGMVTSAMRQASGSPCT